MTVVGAEGTPPAQPRPRQARRPRAGHAPATGKPTLREQALAEPACRRCSTSSPRRSATSRRCSHSITPVHVQAPTEHRRTSTPRMIDMNIQQMMKQAQQMQERLQKQMAELRVEATAGGGMVTVVVNGAKQVQSLKIDPEVVSKDDVEMLQDLIVAAVNDAQRKADEAMSEADGRHDGRAEDPGPVLMTRPDPLTQAHRAAAAPARHRRRRARSASRSTS